MTNESIPPSVPDGKDDPPLDLFCYRVRRLYSAEDIRRDMLGEEPESPPGLVTLSLPLSAALQLSNSLPSGAFDLTRLLGPQSEIGAKLQMMSQTVDEVLRDSMRLLGLQATDAVHQSLESVFASREYRRAMDAMHQMVVQTFEGLGRADAAIAEWGRSMYRAPAIAGAVVPLRPLGMRLDIGRAGIERPYISRGGRETSYEEWVAANPCWPLVFKIGFERDGWEMSLNDLAAWPEFAPAIEVLRQGGLDAYAATLILRGVLKQIISNLRLPDRHFSDMPSALPALLPYLQKRVLQVVSRGNGHLLLSGGELIASKRRGGPPPLFTTPDECRTAVVNMYRALLRSNPRPTRALVAQRLNLSESGLKKALARLGLRWEDLVAAARAK